MVQAGDGRIFIRMMAKKQTELRHIVEINQIDLLLAWVCAQPKDNRTTYIPFLTCVGFTIYKACEHKLSFNTYNNSVW